MVKTVPLQISDPEFKSFYNDLQLGLQELDSGFDFSTGELQCMLSGLGDSTTDGIRHLWWLTFQSNDQDSDGIEDDYERVLAEYILNSGASLAHLSAAELAALNGHDLLDGVTYPIGTENLLAENIFLDSCSGHPTQIYSRNLARDSENHRGHYPVDLTRSVYGSIKFDAKPTIFFSLDGKGYPKIPFENSWRSYYSYANGLGTRSTNGTFGNNFPSSRRGKIYQRDDNSVHDEYGVTGVRFRRIENLGFRDLKRVGLTVFDDHPGIGLDGAGDNFSSLKLLDIEPGEAGELDLGTLSPDDVRQEPLFPEQGTNKKELVNLH